MAICLCHVCKLKSAFNLCCNSEEIIFEGQVYITAKLKMDLISLLARQGNSLIPHSKVNEIFEQSGKFKMYN